MGEARPPPTDLGSETKFALHIAESVLTVWIHHRNLGLHDTTWEQLEQYEIDDQVEVSGSGLLIKDGDEVWYLVDRLDDITLHGEFPKVEA